MKTVLISLLLLASCLTSTQAAVEWRLLQAAIGGTAGDILSIETSLSIRWDGDSPLELIVWSNTVLIDMEVRSEGGAALSQVVTTGPAPAFQRRVILRPGETAKFEAFAGVFSSAHSGGRYTATAKLVGESPSGIPIVIDLGMLEFSPTGEKEKAAEPGATDNPGDAQ